MRISRGELCRAWRLGLNWIVFLSAWFLFSAIIGRGRRGCHLGKTKKAAHCNKNPIDVFPERKSPHSRVCERFIYSQDWSTYFPAAEQADQSWENINRSQTDECGHWDWGPAVPFLGIFVSNFLYCVFSVHHRLSLYLRVMIDIEFSIPLPSSHRSICHIIYCFAILLAYQSGGKGEFHLFIWSLHVSALLFILYCT
jgi:hypothetical protein